MPSRLAGAAPIGAPTCARTARVGLLSTTAGFAIVLLVAVLGRYPGWLQVVALAWMALALTWYAYWLGRLTGSGPACAVEHSPVDEVRPATAADARRE